MKWLDTIDQADISQLTFPIHDGNNGILTGHFLFVCLNWRFDWIFMCGRVTYCTYRFIQRPITDLFITLSYLMVFIYHSDWQCSERFFLITHEINWLLTMKIFFFYLKTPKFWHEKPYNTKLVSFNQKCWRIFPKKTEKCSPELPKIQISTLKNQNFNLITEMLTLEKNWNR